MSFTELAAVVLIMEDGRCLYSPEVDVRRYPDGSGTFTPIEPWREAYG